MSVASHGGHINLVGRSRLETDEGVSGSSDVGDGDELTVGSLVSELERVVGEASWNIPDNTGDSLLGFAEVANVGDSGKRLGGSGWGDGVGWDSSSGW